MFQGGDSKTFILSQCISGDIFEKTLPEKIFVDEVTARAAAPE